MERSKADRQLKFKSDSILNGRLKGSVQTDSNYESLQSENLNSDSEEEDSMPKKEKKGVFSILKKSSSAPPKTSNKSTTMDQDMEFYPIEEHPSPSTFTAWDAFLAGNQAFFREPCLEYPEAAFSYMDVIPEEDDVALLESDTDDTGSSVSTVVDRFSRTSTANSSFSERSLANPVPVSFDLEKVLSPFEKLEKELDESQSKDVPNGAAQEMKASSDMPLVIITSSSSCEDVHNSDDDATVPNGNVATIEETAINNSTESITNGYTDHQELDNSGAKNVEPISEIVTPPIPSRSKFSNGVCKGPGKPKHKKSQPSPPTVTPRKKESYPTPTVPPRMSKHLPARRTRSDPGTPDQPSRIPRPIASLSGSSPVTSRSGPKNGNRSPKSGISKKLKFCESPKSSRTSSTDESQVPEPKDPATTSEAPVIPQPPEDKVPEPGEHQLIDCTTPNQSTKPEPENEDSGSNPFKQTNPFEINPKMDHNPFRSTMGKNNPFKEENQEEKPESLITPETMNSDETASPDCPPAAPEPEPSTTLPDPPPPPTSPSEALDALVLDPAPPRDVIPDVAQPETVHESVGVSSENSQRPLEAILQALDALVQPAPAKEVEINIDWGPAPQGLVNIREKVVPSSSTASGDESMGFEVDGTATEDVQAVLTHSTAGNEVEHPRTPLGPGNPDVPTAGSTYVSHDFRHEHGDDTLRLGDQTDHSCPDMLRHLQSRDNIVHCSSSQFDDEVPLYSEDREDGSVHRHSSGCDDSGVFLEESITSSPETKSRSRTSNEDNKMRQFSIQEGLDSDAEKSDDLGLASSSVDSADDLDGDPLPSTLKLGSPDKQKPPPVPARKSITKITENNKVCVNEISTMLEVPNLKKPLIMTSSSGEDSNFGDNYEIYQNEKTICLNVTTSSNKEIPVKDFLTSRKESHSAFSVAQENQNNHESKSSFLARTLNDNVTSDYLRSNGRHPSPSSKWKSEECLRTAIETKWSLTSRRREKSVSVKDRIAMFSELEANKSATKKDDLQRYGSENNIKVMGDKKVDKPAVDTQKQYGQLQDSKWYSMQSITRKTVEKEPSSLKPSFSIPALSASSTVQDNTPCYATAPVRVEIEPPKPVISSYPETQVTNNKRFNYGPYSLQSLKNKEDLLNKRAAGSSLLSIIDYKKQPLPKLKGLVIPDKPPLANQGKALPTIVNSDLSSCNGSDITRRTSLPTTLITKTMTLPRSNHQQEPTQRQHSLTEPPWKTNTLPKYSPAFKRRTLELPGSSLSPTPPSSLTSPLSPPPSSPSSICSSNASSTLHQNVFQFSLSHSKPVTPVRPEKAIMSAPSDVEYEGDNSEDSSHSVSPMLADHSIKESKNSRNMKCINTSNSQYQNKPQEIEVHSVHIQETLPISTVPSDHQAERKSAVYLSKTEILLKQSHHNHVDSARAIVNGSNGNLESVPVGKFRAHPMELKSSKTNGYVPEMECEVDSKKRQVCQKNGAVVNGRDDWSSPLRRHESEDEEDDDSHSTLSHRTEDSRHTTTDDYLSDATTDSFEKSLDHRGRPRDSDYLSDASPSPRRLSALSPTSRPPHDYFSDDGSTSRRRAPAVDYGPESIERRVDPDLKPRRLSQQQTVLKACAEPSGSAQKFKALAEKWEQRSDVVSPPPVNPGPTLVRRESRPAPVVVSVSGSTTPPGKNGKNGLPPSLMPRNAGQEAKNHAQPNNNNRITASQNGWTDDHHHQPRDINKRNENNIMKLRDEDSVDSRKEFRPISSQMSRDSMWNNEPRNRKGLDFSDLVKSRSSDFTTKKTMSVSDIRRSFENGVQKEVPKPPLPNKAPVVSTDQPPPIVARRKSTPTEPYSVPSVVEQRGGVPQEELERLVSESKFQLSDEEATRLEVQAVVLYREGTEGGSVGITLAGGADYEVKEITVHKVISGSVADREGQLRKGDRLLSINGRNLNGVSHGEALRILKAPGPRVILVLARDKNSVPEASTPVKKKSLISGSSQSFAVQLFKDAGGLGFSIEGGKDSPQGDRPLLVKRIFKGGAADKDGHLEEGDEVVTVNDQPVTNMTRTEVWNFLKKLPEGPVLLRGRKSSHAFAS